MRILKRNLAFVLVMAMAIGMMVTANAANVEDYRDANDIKFTEAVDVLTALGILEGEDGTFHPERTLTREEGAKIITYLMLGGDAADNLSTSVAPFADVAAGRWSAGYIAYCVSQGIVGGYGNGNFGPTDTLTGTQFAKMLLVALGYGVNGEYTGANWEIETNKQALTAGIYEGNLGVNFSNGVKREEAAQYAFNTLANVMQVSYSDVFGAYYSGNIFDGEIKEADEYKWTLGYNLYNLRKTTETITDEFGRDCHKWRSNSKTITEAYHDEADAVYTSSVKASKIYSDLGLTDNTVNARVFIDSNVSSKTFALTKNSDAKTKDIAGANIGNGVIVEAYADTTGATERVSLVVIHTYLGEVEDYDTEKNEVSVDGLTFETAVEYEEDDLVMYTVAEIVTENEDGTDTTTDKLMSVKPAKTVEGKLSAFSADYIMFDGEKYNKANGCLTTNTFDYGTTYALVVDDYGYAVGLDVVEEGEDDSVGYLYVYSVNSNNSVYNNSKPQAEVRFLDGTGTEVVDLLSQRKDGKYEFKMTHKAAKSDSDSTLVTKTEWLDAETELTDDNIKGFYAYTMDGEAVVLKELACVKNVKVIGGEYTAKVSFDGKAPEYTIGDIDPIVGGEQDKVSVNARTVAKVVDGDNKVTTYTGTKNLKFTVELNDDNDPIPVLVVFTNDKAENKLAKEIYVIGDATTESEAVYAYYNGVYEDIEDGIQVELFVGTDVKKYVVDSGFTAESAKGVYSISLNNKDEVSAKAISSKYELVKHAKVTDIEDDYFVDDAGNHNYAEDCVIYRVNNNGLTTAKLSKDCGIDYIKCVDTTSEKYNEVTYIFITEKEWKAAD